MGLRFEPASWTIPLVPGERFVVESALVRATQIFGMFQNAECYDMSKCIETKKM